MVLADVVAAAVKNFCRALAGGAAAVVCRAVGLHVGPPVSLPVGHSSRARAPGQPLQLHSQGWASPPRGRSPRQSLT